MITIDRSASGSWSAISSAFGKPSGGWPPSISLCISCMRSLLTPSNTTTRASAMRGTSLGRLRGAYASDDLDVHERVRTAAAAAGIEPQPIGALAQALRQLDPNAVRAGMERSEPSALDEPPVTVQQPRPNEARRGELDPQTHDARSRALHDAGPDSHRERRLLGGGERHLNRAAALRERRSRRILTGDEHRQGPERCCVALELQPT